MLSVLFRVEGSLYALSCSQIVEVLPLMELRQTTHAPAWHAGEFAYRGALVAVVDACKLLGGYPCSKRMSSRVALVHSSSADLGEVTVGVLAERMTAVRRLDGAALSSSRSSPPSYLGAVVKQDGELVQALDVDGLVRFTRNTLLLTGAPPIGGVHDPD